MSRINFGRVILGGLLAGLVINIGEVLLNDMVFAKELEAMVSRLNIPRPGGAFIGVAVGLSFVLGIVIVLLYAMIRARFGPGPKTAIIASLVPWFCVYIYAGVINSALFSLPVHLLGVGMVWGLVEYSLAGLVGAWLYKDSPSPR